MNDQLVKQLAMQNERIANLYNIGPVQRAEVEQFVEAIVRECMTICEDVTERNDPAVACYHSIKSHFGVGK